MEKNVPKHFYWILVLVALFAVAAGGLGHTLASQQAAQERAELLQRQQIIILCEAQNETRATLFGVLEHLAQPQDDDEPGEYEGRQELLEHFRETLAPRDCPTFADEQEDDIE